MDPKKLVDPEVDPKSGSQEISGSQSGPPKVDPKAPSGSSKVDPKITRKVDPQKWVPEQVDPLKWIPRSGSQSGTAIESGTI